MIAAAADVVEALQPLFEAVEQSPGIVAAELAVVGFTADGTVVLGNYEGDGEQSVAVRSLSGGSAVTL